MKCGDLYRLIESRLSAYFKASVSDLIKKKQKLVSNSSETSLHSFTLSIDDQLEYSEVSYFTICFEKVSLIILIFSLSVSITLSLSLSLSAAPARRSR